MKERGLMLAVSILLVYNAGAWTYLFLWLYSTGRVFAEPNPIIALTEMLLAGLFTLVGIAGFIVAFWNTLKGRMEK